MHVQHQKGSLPTIHKDPIDDHKTHNEKKKQHYHSFFAYCHSKETHTYLLPL